MKGKELIKWIQDNKAEDLDFFIGDGQWQYFEVKPKVQKATKTHKLCILTDAYVEKEMEPKAWFVDDYEIQQAKNEGGWERTAVKWVDLNCLYF